MHQAHSRNKWRKRRPYHTQSSSKWQPVLDTMSTTNVLENHLYYTRIFQTSPLSKKAIKPFSHSSFYYYSSNDFAPIPSRHRFSPSSTSRSLSSPYYPGTASTFYPSCVSASSLSSREFYQHLCPVLVLLLWVSFRRLHHRRRHRHGRWRRLCWQHSRRINWRVDRRSLIDRWICIVGVSLVQ